MRMDAAFYPGGDLRADAEYASRLEAAGFAGVWSMHGRRNPYLPLTIAARKTGSVALGVMDDAGFQRSPMATAQIAWDLARQTGGRFRLGLGSQPPASQGAKIDADWSDRGGRMREVIGSLRAIWQTFQTGERLRYRGRYYQFRLMAPFFNPGPIEQPAIPLWLMADSPEICALAGELCQGIHVSPLHSASWIRDKITPAAAEGLKRAGRSRRDIELAAAVFVISGSDESMTVGWRRRVEARILDLAARLSEEETRHLPGWDYRSGELPDQTLADIAIVAPPEQVVAEAFGPLQGTG